MKIFFVMTRYFDQNDFSDVIKLDIIKLEEENSESRYL